MSGSCSAAELRRVGEVLDEMQAEGLEMSSAIARCGCLFSPAAV